ncbi:MAG: hypothetical protein LBD45_02485, partial [Bacteroidales bacterium]|nr:hypothetical protein [Bacteroidales bacterium]
MCYKKSIIQATTATFLLCIALACAGKDRTLAKQFAAPDAENQPWVYWFWNNGNLTAEGITADLEA